MYFLFENVLICMTCAASFAASFIEFIDVFKHFKYLYQNEKSFIKEWFAKVIFWKWIASSFLLNLTNLIIRPLRIFLYTSPFAERGWFCYILQKENFLDCYLNINSIQGFHN